VLDHKEMEENSSAKNRLAGGFEPLFKDDYTNLFFWVVAMRNTPRIGVFSFTYVSFSIQEMV
jgi:hypothetical protein